ncbi:MAG: iron-containing alcohol dehydrogenase, partial [Pseudomonadota bacterium]|nr:iron-containing alcohol dehydrogenase [Pseudomonadota bacterium]
YDTQHGLTNAILLPVVLRYNLPGLEPKVTRMAQAMALDDDRPDQFIAAVEQLLDDIAIPASLAEIDVPFDCAARIADKAGLDSAAATNPKAADAAEIQRMVETAIKKAR